MQDEEYLKWETQVRVMQEKNNPLLDEFNTWLQSVVAS